MTSQEGIEEFVSHYNQNIAPKLRATGSSGLFPPTTTNQPQGKGFGNAANEPPAKAKKRKKKKRPTRCLHPRPHAYPKSESIRLPTVAYGQADFFVRSSQRSRSPKYSDPKSVFARVKDKTLKPNVLVY